MTADERARLRGLLAAATPGPWGRENEPGGDLCTDDCEVGGLTNGRPTVLLRVNMQRSGAENAALIVALRNGAEGLLDALEEAERSASIWRASAERTAENATAREVALEADLATARRERDEARADADALRALIACSSVRPVLT